MQSEIQIWNAGSLLRPGLYSRFGIHPAHGWESKLWEWFRAHRMHDGRIEKQQGTLPGNSANTEGMGKGKDT